MFYQHFLGIQPDKVIWLEMSHRHISSDVAEINDKLIMSEGSTLNRRYWCMSFNHVVFWTDEMTAKHQDSVKGATRGRLFYDPKSDTN